MRLRSARLALVLGALLWASSVGAQNALNAAAGLSMGADRPTLVLRPEPDMREVAEQVANVLELRHGAAVEVGDAPPPGLLEAVPSGHVAIARAEGKVILVVGIRGGSFLEAHLPVALDGTIDTRAVALALESLHDAALDYAVSVAEVESAREKDRMAQEKAAESAVAPFDASAAPASAREPAPEPGEVPPLSDDGLPRGHLVNIGSPVFLKDVEPFAFVRSYSGASTSSNSVEVGIATGVGVCAVGQCLVLASEVPMTTAVAHDLRYRYVTFLASVYSRPFHFGAFTPGVSLGLLSRVGHFNADMGLAESDGRLDTDLGLRGSAELALAVVEYADLMAEAGLDIALDRTRVSDGTTERSRGQRVSPWLQMAIRVRTSGR